jgi:hypothetical protein
MSIGQTNTQQRHVERAWRRIQQEAENQSFAPAR